MCVCVCVRVYDCGCVCVWKREVGKEESVCVYLCEGLCESEKESECGRGSCVWVCLREWEQALIYVRLPLKQYDWKKSIALKFKVILQSSPSLSHWIWRAHTHPYTPTHPHTHTHTQHLQEVFSPLKKPLRPTVLIFWQFYFISSQICLSKIILMTKHFKR